MIKALFFDIDGTLVSFKTHQIPVSTIEALEAYLSGGEPRLRLQRVSAEKFGGSSNDRKSK